jgi:2-polyprenyl-3-methyl-5-hydroxy-6-metoxy-1,4-benzoquinol methylase
VPAPALRHARVRRHLGPPARVLEQVIGGGRLRERLLLAALRAHYASRFRREWLWTDQPPHFFGHRMGALDLAFGAAKSGPYPWFRAFFAADVIRPGDVLLDIGSGDGFFTARFLAPRCRAVDGVDVGVDAIAIARRDNAVPNVRYHLVEAVGQPFPRERYDVIVWDGALRHFGPEATETVLVKAKQALAADGIFCGSESLGEGIDHLQFFASVDDGHDVLSLHFPHVWVREVGYQTGRHFRREAFWRASSSPARHEAASWRSGSRSRS